MPQKPNIVATKTTSGEIHIFNIDQHGNNPKDAVIRPEMRLTGHTQEGFGLCWSPHKEGLLLSGANDSKVCLFDIGKSTTPIKELTFHSSLVGDVGFSNLDPEVFGSVSDDKKVILYDIRQSGFIHEVKGAHQGEVNSLDFNYFNKNLFITASNDGKISSWDIRDLSRRLHTFDQHTKEVLICKWNPKVESLFLSSSNDRRINIWDTSKIGVEQSVADAEDGPAELIFTHGGHTARISDVGWNMNEELMVASVAEDSVIHLWEMANYIYYGEEDYDDDDEHIKIDN